jgi:hypothetical protein
MMKTWEEGEEKAVNSPLKPIVYYATTGGRSIVKWRRGGERE